MEVLHKLRNRLLTIQSSTDLLLDLAISAGHPSELIEQISADLQHAIDAQVRFLGELQLVTLLRQQRLILHRTSVDLPALVARVAQQLDADFQAHQCLLTISIDDNIPPVWADEPRLEQVLCRLLDNALQSTQENAGSANVVLVRIAADDNSVTCCIEDTGRGIASDDLAHVVAQLERTVPDAQPKNISLELGDCAQLLRLYGGTLAITSRGIGHGATVCIRLPTAAPS
jgi:two-component system, sensor histidine kinase ChiS